MNHSMLTRRAVIKAAPIGIAVLATSVPNAEGAQRPDPDAVIDAAFIKWSAAYDALADNEDRAIDDHLFNELRACERACVKLAPVTARGLALQFLVFTAFGEFEATKSADHDFEATMLRLAGVTPPRGLAGSESVRDLLDRLAGLPMGSGQ